MPYSEISEGDRKEIERNSFVEDTLLELDSVTVKLMKENYVNRYTIMTNDICGSSMKNFVTYWRPKLNRGKSEKAFTDIDAEERREFLTAAEMKQLIVGTKFHRRLPSTRYIPDGDTHATFLMEIVSQIVMILTII